MSKLTRLIRRVSQGEDAPLGFAARRRSTGATMLLVALVGDRWRDRVSDAAASGADAFLLTGAPSPGDVAACVSAAGERPCGALAPSEPARVAELAGGALDFLVVERDASAAVLEDEERAHLLHISTDIGDIELRTLDALPIDGAYLDIVPAALTIDTLIHLRRVSGLSRQAVLLPVHTGADEHDLLALRDSGVALLGVDLASQGAAELARLRGVIDGLPPRRRSRRKEVTEALLPRVSAGREDADDEEDED